MYCRGIGVKRDFSESVSWFRKAVEHGKTPKTALAKNLAAALAVSRTILGI
jgi:TPR repeat protein